MPHVGRHPPARASYVQSIIFDDEVWNPIAAAQWLQHHHHYFDAYHHLGNHWRFRQFDPIDSDLYTSRNVGHGITFVIGFRPWMSR